MGISGLVSSISVMFKPIVWFLSVSTNLVLRLCGIDPNEAEELVGELNNESASTQNDEPYIEQMDEGTWKIFGNVDLREIQEVMGIEIVSTDCNTFTGMVFDPLGMIPNEGAQILIWKSKI